MQQSSNIRKVSIRTASKEYPVLIGENASKLLPEVLQSFAKPPSKVLIITDDCVARFYLSVIEALLEGDFELHTFVLKNGESAKSFENYYAIQSFALEKGLDRQSAIIALGGGVVGDIAGFAASTYMRGIKFIQIPTTLLAHDSAVGGKVAINHPLGKNMIGSFYQPEAVIYDVNFLQSLPVNELRSGFAEVVKHSLIWDPEFFQWIKDNISSLDDLRDEKLLVCLEKGIKIKAAVVSTDEKEEGLRAILNFGHTLGHALESAYGYGKITHGDGVAIGMLFATKLSEDVYPSLSLSKQLKEAWDRYGFPTSINKEIQSGTIIKLMKMDKKSQKGHIHMVLIQSIGKVVLQAVPDEVVSNKLAEFFE